MKGGDPKTKNEIEKLDLSRSRRKIGREEKNRICLENMQRKTLVLNKVSFLPQSETLL